MREEIRKAGMQATGLVRQLLAVARPTNIEPRLLSLNEIAEGMRNLLVRLIGENIELKFQLDPNLGLIKMDPTQCQQILLNLVLNARDAMPGGGQITVETSNCKVQVLTESRPVARHARPRSLARFSWWPITAAAWMKLPAPICLKLSLPPKPSKGTGLGLATVHDIVTSNGGLIHVESAPASRHARECAFAAGPGGSSQFQRVPKFSSRDEPGSTYTESIEEEE